MKEFFRDTKEFFRDTKELLKQVQYEIYSLIAESPGAMIAIILLLVFGLVANYAYADESYAKTEVNAGWKGPFGEDAVFWGQDGSVVYFYNKPCDSAVIKEALVTHEEREGHGLEIFNSAGRGKVVNPDGTVKAICWFYPPDQLAVNAVSIESTIDSEIWFYQVPVFNLEPLDAPAAIHPSAI